MFIQFSDKSIIALNAVVSVSPASIDNGDVVSYKLSYTCGSSVLYKYLTSDDYSLLVQCLRSTKNLAYME